MAFDLKNMSRKELEKLARSVEKQLARLQQKDLKKVRAEMEKLAAAHGVSVQDVLGGIAPAKKTAKTKPKTKSVARYANPADPSQTWTGKGRQPNWFKDAIDAGTSPENMAI